MFKSFRSLLICLSLLSGIAQAQTTPSVQGAGVFAEPQAQVAAVSRCTRYDGPFPVSGTDAPGYDTVAYGPYTTSCTGTHQAGLSAGSLPMTIKFQVLSGGAWLNVTSSTSGYVGSSSRAPGTYRWVIQNTGTASVSWTLNVTTPLP
jgi:hypothetical protein